MSLFSKLFRPPVKEWEREYIDRPTAPKVKHKPAEKIPHPEPDSEFEEHDSGPGFLSRVLGPSRKEWEQEYADRGIAPRIEDDSLDEPAEPEPEPASKLQKALREIARENRQVPDIFRKKAKRPAPPSAKKDTAKRSAGRYVPAASMPEIEGAVTSAIAALGATSPQQSQEVVEAAQARLKGKTVDAKILNEKVKAKLG
jgi:hypothetical protein